VCFRWCRIAALSALFLALCLAIYLGEAGLPEWAKNRIVAAAQAQGVRLTFASMRLHWLQGITVENAVVEGDGLPGSFKAERVVLDLDQGELLHRRLRLKSLALHHADLSLSPEDRNLDPIVVHELEGRVSFPETNVVSLDHLEGRWRSGIFSMQMTATNLGAMAGLWTKGSAPSTGRRSLTNQVDRIALALSKLDLKGAPSLRIVMAGDAAKPLDLTAVFALSVPGAATPWGTVTNLNLEIRTTPQSETSTLKLTADGAETPWGQASTVDTTVVFKPTTDDASEWQAGFRASLANPRTARVAADSVELDGQARFRIGDLWPTRFDANLAAIGPTSRWAHATALAVKISRSEETNTWIAPTDKAALAMWTNLLPHRLELGFEASQLSVLGLDIRSLGAELNWNGPLLTLSRLEATVPSGSASVSGVLDVPEHTVTGSLKTDFDLSSVRDLLTPSGRNWLDQFQWSAPPKIAGNARLVLPAWTDAVESWREDIQPGLQLSGTFDVDQVVFQKIAFDHAVGTFSHTNLVWHVQDARLSRPEGGIQLNLASEGRGAHQTIRFLSTIDPEALKPVLGEHADKVFEMVRFPKPPLIEGTADIFRDDLKRSTFFGRVATTNVHVRDVDTGLVSAGVAVEWPWVRFENTRIERGTQWLAAPLMLFNLDDQMLSISNGTAQADIEPVGRIIGPKTWGMLSPYEFLDPPLVEINGITPVHEEDRPKADLHFKIKAQRFRWKFFNIDRFTGDARWTGNGLELTNLEANAYSGTVGGWAEFGFQEEGPVDFKFRSDVDGLNLKTVLNDLGVTNRVQGRLTGNLIITDGSSYRPTGWNGYGHADLTNGFIWDYPVFAFLSPILDAIAPGTGRDAARSARGDYYITNSVIFTDKLEIRAATLRLNYRGSVTFDHVLNARVEATLLRDTWLVGPLLSLALSPFSRVFEYRVTGTLSEPKMEPIYVPSVLMKLLSPLEALKTPASATPDPGSQGRPGSNPKVDDLPSRP
jgi:hypothetical protein